MGQVITYPPKFLLLQIYPGRIEKDAEPRRLQMEKFIPVAKRSKAEQKKFYRSQRGTWNGISPVTRMVPNGKAYSRAKEKQAARSAEC